MKSLQLLMILALGCVSATALAAEPKPAQPATPAATPAAEKPGAESAAPAKDEVSKKEADEESAPPAKPASAADKKSSPQRFVPSEQVRADFDVSFPIDI